MDDVLIVGGGAAGLSAALMLGRALRRVTVVDAGAPRNRFAAHMHGVLGHDGLDPADLLARGREEVAKYGVATRPGTVSRLEDRGDRVVATLDDRTTELAARHALIATGIRDDLPAVPGLAERWGRTVLHCPYCHGWEVRGRSLGVLATSPASLHQATLVRQWSDRLTIFSALLGPLSDQDAARFAARGIGLVDAPVVEIAGDAPDGEVVVRTADGAETVVDALFTGGRPVALDEFAVGLRRAETPFGAVLATEPPGRTSSPRIWAAGNVVDPWANVPVAMAAGASVGGAVNAALVEEDVEAAVEQWRG